MDIQETRHGAVTVVRPVGALVAADALQVRQKLDSVATRSLGRFVIDASAVAFLDSAGLETLVEAAESMAASGQALKLCGANETVREVLDLAEVISLFEFFADPGDAARSFL